MKIEEFEASLGSLQQEQQQSAKTEAALRGENEAAKVENTTLRARLCEMKAETQRAVEECSRAKRAVTVLKSHVGNRRR
jgi:regulator of replication initiation timing